jgi:hypothetical protein
MLRLAAYGLGCAQHTRRRAACREYHRHHSLARSLAHLLELALVVVVVGPSVIDSCAQFAACAELLLQLRDGAAEAPHQATIGTASAAPRARVGGYCAPAAGLRLIAADDLAEARKHLPLLRDEACDELALEGNSTLVNLIAVWRT